MCGLAPIREFHVAAPLPRTFFYDYFVLACSLLERSYQLGANSSTLRLWCPRYAAKRFGKRSFSGTMVQKQQRRCGRGGRGRGGGRRSTRGRGRGGSAGRNSSVKGSFSPMKTRRQRAMLDSDGETQGAHPSSRTSSDEEETSNIESAIEAVEGEEKSEEKSEETASGIAAEPEEKAKEKAEAEDGSESGDSASEIVGASPAAEEEKSEVLDSAFAARASLDFSSDDDSIDEMLRSKAPTKAEQQARNWVASFDMDAELLADFLDDEINDTDGEVLRLICNKLNVSLTNSHDEDDIREELRVFLLLPKNGGQHRDQSNSPISGKSSSSESATDPTEGTTDRNDDDALGDTIPGEQIEEANEAIDSLTAQLSHLSIANIDGVDVQFTASDVEDLDIRRTPIDIEFPVGKLHFSIRQEPGDLIGRPRVKPDYVQVLDLIRE